MSDDFDNIPPWLLDDDDDDGDAEGSSEFENAGGFPIEDDTDLVEDSMLWSQDVASQTGELNPDDVPESQADESDDVPDWLTGVEDSDADMTFSGSTAEGDDVPDWMSTPLDPESASPAPEDTGETPAIVPGWLDNPEATAEEEAGELPPWLAEEDDDEQAAQTFGDFTTDEGTLSEAWLAQAETLSDTNELDMTYDEWMARQEESEREVDVEEEVPVDLFLDDGTSRFDPDEIPDVGATGELPDWYLGLDSVDQTGSLVTHDTMDLSEWLEQAKPDESPPEEAPAFSDEFEAPDDLFGDFAADTSSEELPNTGDLFGDFAMDAEDFSGEELPNTGELFGDFAMESSDEPSFDDDAPDLDAFLAESPSEGETDLPQTGELFGDFDAEAVPEEEEFDLDAFLVDDAVDDAQPAMELYDDDDDLFDSILGAAPTPEAVGEDTGFEFDEGDDDLLDSILSSTPAPEEAAEPQPVVDFSEDDDFFESLLDTSPKPEDMSVDDSNFDFTGGVMAEEADQISADLEALDTDYNFEFDAGDAVEDEPDLDALFGTADLSSGDPDVDEPTLDDIFGMGEPSQEEIADFAEQIEYDPAQQEEIEAFLSDIGLDQFDEEPAFTTAEDEAEQLSAEEFGFDFGLADDTDEESFDVDDIDFAAYADEPPIPESIDTADLGIPVEEDRDTVEFEDMDTGELAPESMIAEPIDEAPITPEPEPIEAEDERVDWFAEEEPTDITPDDLEGVPQRGSTVLDWLADVEEVSDTEIAELLQKQQEKEEEAAEPEPAIEVEGIEFSDIDDYLASLDDLTVADEEAAPPAEDEFTFDQMLATGTFDIVEDADEAAAAAAAIEAGQIEPDRPDWLTELGAVVGTVSASAMIRQRKDRNLNELPERVQRLHQRGENLTEPIDAPDRRRAGAALAEVLTGVDDALMALPSTTTGTTGLSQALQLSKAQQNQLNLLMNMVAFEEQGKRAATVSAIDLTYSKSDAGLADDPFADLGLSEPLGDVVEEEAPATTAVKARPRRRRYNVVRFLVALLVAVAVIMPFFVAQVRVGDLPPSSFAAGSSEQSVFNAINAVRGGQLVLFAVEYNPTAAGELDALTTAMLQHVLLRGGRPVIVSRSPVGLLHANNIINELSTDADFQAQYGETRTLVANRDYYVVRYLVGDIVGLRELAETPVSVVQTDLSGNFTGLAPDSLDDFALTIVIAERPEALRDWAEQIAPQSSNPMVAGTSFSAAPVAIPYVQAGQNSNVGIQGLVVGFEDAYTYSQLVATLEANTEIVTEAADGEEETTGSTELAGVVNTDQPINVRSGPGTEFFAVTVLQPGEAVTVIDVNDAGDWLQVRAADGSEGWVLGSLITIQIPEDDAANSMTESPDANESMTEENLDNQQSSTAPQFVRVASVSPLPVQQDEDAAPEGETADEDTTADADETTAQEPADGEAAAQDDSEDEAAADDETEADDEAPTTLITAADAEINNVRWYSMTFSTIVIIIIIALSSVFNVLRGLRRRRRSA